MFLIGLDRSTNGPLPDCMSQSGPSLLGLWTCSVELNPKYRNFIIWEDTIVYSCTQNGRPMDTNQCQLDCNTALKVIQHWSNPPPPKTMGKICLMCLVRTASVSKLVTSNFHGEILNLFYLYNIWVMDPLPLYLYIVKREDFHQILTAFLTLLQVLFCKEFLALTNTFSKITIIYKHISKSIKLLWWTNKQLP